MEGSVEIGTSKRTDVANETFTVTGLCPGRASQELSELKNAFPVLHLCSEVCYKDDDT